MNRHLLAIMVGVLTFIFGQAIIPSDAYTRGKVKASLDALRGQQIIYMVCQSSETLAGFNRVYNEYGIEIVDGGCHISQKLDEEQSGYNAVSVEAIAEKYGNDFFQMTRLQSKDEYYGESNGEDRVPKD